MSLNEMFSRIKGDHALMMVVCCLVPLLLLGLAWYLGVDRGLVSFGFLLLCPLMHFFLMGDMHKGHANGTQSNGGSGAKEAGRQEKCH